MAFEVRRTPQVRRTVEQMDTTARASYRPSRGSDSVPSSRLVTQTVTNGSSLRATISWGRDRRASLKDLVLHRVPNPSVVASPGSRTAQVSPEAVPVLPLSGMRLARLGLGDHAYLCEPLPQRRVLLRRPLS